MTMRIPATKLFFLLTAIVLFSSCKKSVVFGDVAINTFRPIVEFSDPYGFKMIAMDYTTSEITLDITDIRFMIRSEISLDAVAKISLSSTVVDDYNAANGTNYTAVTVPAFALENDQFTLTPGERSKRIRIRISPATVATGENAIGMVITDVTNGEPSQIAGKLVIALSVKNKYDGVYRLDGAFYHPSFSPGYDAFTINVEMHTSGPNSVKIFMPEFDGFYHPGLFNGSFSAFSGQEPEYTVDPVTKNVTVQNSFPGTATIYTMAAGFNSRFDPATKKIYAKFGYNYGTGTVFVPASTREWTDELTYLGPR